MPPEPNTRRSRCPKCNRASCANAFGERRCDAPFPSGEAHIPFWHDSEDRDRGKEPDYYLTADQLDEGND